MNLPSTSLLGLLDLHSGLWKHCELMGTVTFTSRVMGTCVNLLATRLVKLFGLVSRVRGTWVNFLGTRVVGDC